MSARIKFAGLWLFSAVLLTGIVGCPSTTTGGKPAAEKPGSSDKAADPQPTTEKADFPAMSAADFAKEVAADGDAAKKKYKDKKIIIEGVIVDKIGDGTARSAVILTGHKGDKPVDVQCELAIIDAYTVDQLKKSKAGDKVKVLGELLFATVTPTEKGNAVVELNGCKFVK
jgi:hypothetical protein